MIYGRVVTWPGSRDIVRLSHDNISIYFEFGGHPSIYPYKNPRVQRLPYHIRFMSTSPQFYSSLVVSTVVDDGGRGREGGGEVEGAEEVEEETDS